MPLGFWSNSWSGPTSSFAVQSQAETMLLDVGVDPVGSLRAAAIHPSTVSHVFISHLHSDHSSGFANLIFTRQTLMRKNDPNTKPVQVFAEAVTIQGLRDMVAIQYPDRKLAIDWHEAEEAKVLSFTESLSVTFLPTRHKISGLSARLDAPTGPLVGYQADSRPTEKDPRFFQGVDLLIAECFAEGSSPDDRSSTHTKGHSTFYDALQLAKDAGVSSVLPYHLPETYRADTDFHARAHESFSKSGIDLIDPLIRSSIHLQSKT
ncbi:MBL fold metallo-hydrolase [Amycolatopsis sp. NPDC048633]|uniref:MBL fold metallo-hydrolase n=1 Tax=Amycolatopsis sp. NPDC048633 TaxID=3157095 RepID=UPI0033FD4387